MGARGTLSPSQRLIVLAAFVLTVGAAISHGIAPDGVSTFVLCAVALASQAALVGESIEQVGERLGPGATGLMQSTIGNLPELLVGIFALRAGLISVMQAALVGSVLASSLLVLGIAILGGGLRHGSQRFASQAPRMIGTLLLVSVAALLVPTLVSELHVPAAAHVGQLSNLTAAVLIVVYLLSIPFWLRGGAITGPDERQLAERPAVVWPMWLSVVLLAAAGFGAALVSDWFVAALQPATRALGLSETFTGLVVVAIASNAVENFGGVRFALKGRPDYALATILNSPLQVALFLTPLLVVADRVFGHGRFTLVFPSLEVVVLAIAAIVVVVVIYDGEYIWLEGVALIGLYCIAVAAFWWG
jgi:Ca2+:H+ antiporter